MSLVLKISFMQLDSFKWELDNSGDGKVGRINCFASTILNVFLFVFSSLSQDATFHFLDL